MMAYCPFSGLVGIVKTITYTPFHGVVPTTIAVVDPAGLESNLCNPEIWTGPQSHVKTNLVFTTSMDAIPVMGDPKKSQPIVTLPECGRDKYLSITLPLFSWSCLDVADKASG